MVLVAYAIENTFYREHILLLLVAYALRAQRQQGAQTCNTAATVRPT
jgi:hypothetical protein